MLSTENTGLGCCKTLECLIEHNGNVVWVEGSYIHPKSKSIEPHRLLLSDGTTVVLTKVQSESVLKNLKPENSNAVLRVMGRIFTDKIPDLYGIIARTAEPYLLDIQEIKAQ